MKKNRSGLRMQLRILAAAGLTGVMMAGLSLTSYAQSYLGTFEYSDTYTTNGTSEDFYTTDGFHWNAEVCELTNRDFSITVNYQGMTDNIGSPYHIDMVWVGKIEGQEAHPITNNPWEEEGGVDVNKIGDNTYNLSGLNIENDIKYGFFVEFVSEYVPGSWQGSGSATYATFFKINSSGSNELSNTNDSGNNNNSNSDSVYYYWANNEKGWWVQCSNGTYLTNQWYQDPKSNLYYYMGADGYMLTNATTPDGYVVNGDGVWVQNVSFSGIGGNYKLVKEEYLGDVMQSRDDTITVNVNEDGSVTIGDTIYSKVDDTHYKSDDTAGMSAGMLTFLNDGSMIYESSFSEGFTSFYQKL